MGVSGSRATILAVSAASSRLVGRRWRLTNSAGRAVPGGPFRSRRFVATTSASAIPVSAENARSKLPEAATAITATSS